MNSNPWHQTTLPACATAAEAAAERGLDPARRYGCHTPAPPVLVAVLAVQSLAVPADSLVYTLMPGADAAHFEVRCRNELYLSVSDQGSGSDPRPLHRAVLAVTDAADAEGRTLAHVEVTCRVDPVEVAVVVQRRGPELPSQAVKFIC